MLNHVGSVCLACNVRICRSVNAAIVSNRQNARRARQKRECMLVHVHRACTPAGITAGGIVPHCSCARCKPDVKSVEEDTVGVVRIYGDPLVVPVLRIIASATLAVS